MSNEPAFDVFGRHAFCQAVRGFLIVGRLKVPPPGRQLPVCHHLDALFAGSSSGRNLAPGRLIGLLSVRATTGQSPKVLQVVLSLNPGGTERLVVELVRRLRPELPMAVCCLDEEGSWGEGLRHENVGVTALRR